MQPLVTGRTLAANEFTAFYIKISPLAAGNSTHTTNIRYQISVLPKKFSCQSFPSVLDAPTRSTTQHHPRHSQKMTWLHTNSFFSQFPADQKTDNYWRHFPTTADHWTDRQRFLEDLQSEQNQQQTSKSVTPRSLSQQASMHNNADMGWNTMNFGYNYIKTDLFVKADKSLQMIVILKIFQTSHSNTMNWMKCQQKFHPDKCGNSYKKFVVIYLL